MIDRPILFSAAMILAILAGRKTQTRRVVNLAQLRVRLPYEVRSDFSTLIPDRAIIAKPGVYRASMNAHGAVSINVGGKLLGVKPGEFDFVCPYAEGTTRLVDGRWRIEAHRDQRLWVRETWAPAFGSVSHEYGEHSVSEWDDEIHGPLAKDAHGLEIYYRADGEDALPAEFSMPHGSEIRWRPSIHMPRWASRITLKVAGVRIERVAGISAEDARAEGLIEAGAPDLRLFSGGEDFDSHSDPRDAFHELWESINGGRPWRCWDDNPFVWVVEFKRVEAQRRAA